MRGLLQDEAALADAYLAWWRIAGADGAVGEQSVNWLRAPSSVSTPPSIQPVSISNKPQSLEAFHEWLGTDPGQVERRWPGSPILPVGGEQAPVMVITDMPDPADMVDGQLFADHAGTLFNAMLRAIGLDRSAIHLASLFTLRPPGGMVEAGSIAQAVERMRMHVALARPARLLLLGDRTVRALLATNNSGDGKALRDFNHEGGIVPAVATFHPRLLLTQPAAKAECWRTLQYLIEGTHS